MQRIPLLYLPEPIVKRMEPILLGISSRIAGIFPGIKYDIEQSNLGVTSAEYIARVLANTFLFFLFFFGFLFFIMNWGTERGPTESARMAVGLSIGFCGMLTLILFRYPKIMAGKKAQKVNKHLVFALKDLLLQVGAGVSLYNGIVNVSKAGYGQVSIEFEIVAKNVITGMPVVEALEQMALQSKSEYLRKTTWQLINTLKAGASVKTALHTIIMDLTAQQRTTIADYARELNLYTLVYMIFAVAIPTIGAVMLVILSSFAGLGITRGMFMGFLALNAVIQYIIIGFVKSRRPMVVI